MVPVRSPHTSYRWRGERVIEPIKRMGIIRRPWLTRASGGNLARTPFFTVTVQNTPLYKKCHGIFNDHRELGPRFNVLSERRCFFDCIVSLSLSWTLGPTQTAGWTPPTGLTNTSSNSNLVFPGGLPSRYWPGSALLSFSGQPVLGCRVIWLPAIYIYHSFFTAKLPKGRVYPLSIPERTAMEEYVKEALQQGFIRPSTSPAASSFFFVAKKDGGLRPCIDYRALNDQTVKFAYPLPLVPASLEELRDARIFSKLDLRSAYNLIRIRKGDEWKTAFITPTGHYEYRVMPYGHLSPHYWNERPIPSPGHPKPNRPSINSSQPSVPLPRWSILTLISASWWKWMRPPWELVPPYPSGRVKPLCSIPAHTSPENCPRRSRTMTWGTASYWPSSSLWRNGGIGWKGPNIHSK